MPRSQSESGVVVRTSKLRTIIDGPALLAGQGGKDGMTRRRASGPPTAREPTPTGNDAGDQSSVSVPDRSPPMATRPQRGS